MLGTVKKTLGLYFSVDIGRVGGGSVAQVRCMLYKANMSAQPSSNKGFFSDRIS